MCPATSISSAGRGSETPSSAKRLWIPFVSKASQPASPSTTSFESAAAAASRWTPSRSVSTGSREHGANWTHNTKDCRFLKEKKTGGFKNKTWNRKASEASDQSKKDLAAILSKAVNKAVKKQLASVDKKRKSDDEEGECYLVDTLTQELEGFNYETMEGLTIEDDEVSV